MLMIWIIKQRGTYWMIDHSVQLIMCLGNPTFGWSHTGKKLQKIMNNKKNRSFNP